VTKPPVEELIVFQNVIKSAAAIATPGAITYPEDLLAPQSA
jgi:hypothetical protein